MEAVEETFADIEGKRKIFREVVLTADSGFNSEQSVRKLLDRGIEAYVADRYFRQRNPRFERQKEYKKKTIDRKRTSKARKYLPAAAFQFDANGTLICPAGVNTDDLIVSELAWQEQGLQGPDVQGFREILQCV